MARKGKLEKNKYMKGRGEENRRADGKRKDCQSRSTPMSYPPLSPRTSSHEPIRSMNFGRVTGGCWWTQTPDQLGGRVGVFSFHVRLLGQAVSGAGKRFIVAPLRFAPCWPPQLHMILLRVSLELEILSGLEDKCWLFWNVTENVLDMKEWQRGSYRRTSRERTRTTKRRRKRKNRKRKKEKTGLKIEARRRRGDTQRQIVGGDRTEKKMRGIKSMNKRKHEKERK